MKRILGLGGAVVFWLSLAITGVAQTDQEGAAQPELRVTKTEILAVQSRLQERGYFGEKPDGKFDRATRGALRSFQADQGLPVTSRIDLATARAVPPGRRTLQHSGLWSTRPTAPAAA